MTLALNKIEIQNQKDDIKAIQTLKKRGIHFVTPSPQAMKDWQTSATAASKKMVESGTLPVELAEQLDNYLKQFQSILPVTHAP